MVLSKDKLWESGHDETVEVNQRALIDKVLARYSGEFTVFRELLQNSDDAQSEAVEIRFETQAYMDRKLGADSSTDISKSPLGGQLPDLRTALVHQWTFKNNGNIFRDEDWSRLKKIAEGNPDEEKIGAFGVGFYSLFSVTEEPFVTSGNQWMGFYWKDKKDQLFARRGELPESDEDPSSRAWTSFTMALREPAPIPIAFDFTRFLASSLTFMGHLREVCVYFDDKRLARLNKASGMPLSLGIPRGLKNRSPSGIMTVDNIETTPLFIQAQVMKWIYTSGTEKKRQNPPNPVKAPGAASSGFFSSLFNSLSATSTPQRTVAPLPPVEKPIDHLAISETSVSLSIYSATIQVRLDKKLSSELQRSTKKNPPAKMKFELIYTAKDEYDASLEEETKHPEATGSIFQGLRADLDGLGAARVFIGHSTAQSTGVGGHISARFIPTVERESIDFMDRHVAVWNKELLFIGGFLSRAAYEFELIAVQKMWTSSKSESTSEDHEIQVRATNQVLHALKFFMFYTSTPSPDVSALMESAFFECSTDRRFSIISSKGVRDVGSVRLPDPTFSAFLKELPTLPDSVMIGAPLMVSALQSRGLIKQINFQDVLRELQSRPLTEDEFVACLKWWTTIYQEGDRDRLAPIRTQLINSVILTYETDNKDQKVVPLSSIKSFVSSRSPCAHIPLDSPLPEYLLPNSVSKLFKPDVLSSCFPWTEFTIVQWLSFICESGGFAVEYDISLSPPWAERVFTLIVRVWPTIAAASKAEIVRLLRLKTCIPTSGGMSLPQQAYFPNVNIFGDLPVVKFSSGLAIKGTTEKVLQDLGVRKHVELQLVFNRMIKTNEWTIADLTKYLVSVRASLTPEEYQRLKATAAFPKEIQDGPGDNGKRVRYMANQLYEPLDVFRAMKLPIIDWGKQLKWKNSSEEGKHTKFLFDLGLQRQPPLNQLIELCASEDSSIRSVALKYLIDHMETRYPDYDPFSYKTIRFIPALRGSEQCLGTIQEVFSAQWAAVGILVLHPSYQTYAAKLKIQDHPPVAQLMSLLQSKPPGTESEARELFRLLAGRVNDFKTSDLRTLSTTAFVPVKGEKNAAGPLLRWLPPSQCYLGSGGSEGFHSKLFVFVDFGAAANAFLTACGTRSQPSVEELAKILLNSPREFYELAQGPVNFLSELRNLAVNAKAISPGTILRMKRAPILLALQRKSKHQVKASDDWDEDEWDINYSLKKPNEIIVADDTHAYQAFGESLFTAPQEDIIEAFYCHLGSLKLSQVVREEYKTTVELRDSKAASEIRSLILERLPLFLHEHTHARTRVSFSWFSANKNFVVKAFGKLGVIKHLNHGTLKLSKNQDASAVAQRIGSSPIELWIAGNAQVDMYEVATALNRMLFDSPKANDALLFMTILSTDLRSLKRRGYNVDRILRQQKDARLAAESDRMAKEKEKAAQIFLPALPPALPPPNTRPAAKENQDTHPSDLYDGQPLPPTSIAGRLQNFRRKMGSIASPSPLKPASPTHGQPGPQPSASTTEGWSENEDQRNSLDSLGHTHPTNTPDNSSGITPISNISKNIEMAVSSCRSESADLLSNRQQMQRVKESLNDGYCDISGRKGDLHHIGQMGPVKVYLSEEIPSHQAGKFMEEKQHSLARFVHIMKLLATIYDLPLTKLHVFYDLSGGIIAFNRNGSIFLNLRYFEEWHDADVKNEKLQDAYISWYFTIAHEIAHNLVQPHNSEHEFYFSAICERYIIQLAQQLQSTVKS